MAVNMLSYLPSICVCSSTRVGIATTGYTHTKRWWSELFRRKMRGWKASCEPWKEPMTSWRTSSVLPLEGSLFYSSTIHLSQRARKMLIAVLSGNHLSAAQIWRHFGNVVEIYNHWDDSVTKSVICLWLSENYSCLSPYYENGILNWCAFSRFKLFLCSQQLMSCLFLRTACL
jgi:hypothetical protein